MVRIGTATGLLVAGALLTAACSGSDSTEPEPSVITTTTEVAQVRVDDGLLRFGAIIPTTDAGVGVALEQTLQTSVASINDSGGVLGNDVELLVVDEGTTSESAAQAVNDLVEAGVDAIIGPTSSNNAVGALDAAVSAGIVTCSPTAGAISLDSFPDDGLFFRSIATDSLQAVAIAQQAQLTGATRIAIVHVDDAYGRPYAEAVSAQIDFAEVTTVSIAVGETDLGNELTAVRLSEAPVLVVVGSGRDTATFLTALAASEVGAGITDIIVNDAARSVDARQARAELPAALRDRILGVAPQIVIPARSEDEPPPLPFAAQVDDCVNLISLSAVQAQTDSPEDLATQMSSVSSGGSVCRDFAECSTRRAENREIDYNGDTGITDLGRNGDPSRARFDLFRFDEEGGDVVPETGAIQFVAAFDSL